MESLQHPFVPLRRNDPELEVHSVDVEETPVIHSKFSGASSRTPRTKWRDHYVIDIKGKSKEEEKVADLSFKSIHTSTKSPKHFNDYGYDDTVSEDFKDKNKSHTLDLGVHYTWSDDEESLVHEKEGIGYSIYDSIRAIRKEASKIDAVLAVDQVDRLQEEMKNLRSELKRQNAETAELATLVQMKEDQIGTLELERDLYKADTNKLANDLECCLMKLRRVGGTSSPIAVGYGRSGEVPIEDDNDITYTNDVTSDPPQPTTADESTTSDPISQLDKSTSHLLPLGCTESLTGTSFTTATTGTISCTDARPLLLSKEVNKLPVPPSVIPVVEKPRLVPKSRQGTPQRAPLGRNNVETTSAQRYKKGLSFAFCRQNNKNTSRSKIRSINTATKKPTADSQKKQHSKNSIETNQPETSQFPCGMLQEQVQDMSQRLQSSLKSSEDLRRRIASVHSYYDRQVHELDRRIVEVCVERSKLEFDLSRHQIDISDQDAHRDQESKFRNQDPQIQTTRKPRVVTFNV